MTHEEITRSLFLLSGSSPLIHCITNPISINFCANAILALSCRPMMAEHPKEVCEITESADALLLNLGNITDVRMQSMKVSAECANREGIPCVLDLVGVACSKLRRSFAGEILGKFGINVIKGNYSEIYAMVEDDYESSGVDSDGKLDLSAVCKAACILARRYDCIVMASGSTDIVTDGKSGVHIFNGSPAMSKVTGTGCVLGAVCACFLSVCDGFTAAVSACVILGICGEMIKENVGNGSFAVRILDKLSCITKGDIERNMKIREFSCLEENDDL